MSTSVKRIESTMRGAPTLNGTPGSKIAVLDALFVSGWGPTTALSVNVSGGVATATLTPGETFDRDAVVLVAGATPAALNGEARVLSTSNSSITWATTAPDGAATGTITIRYAPQTSWSKVYAATNKAVYRSTHVQSNGHYLRIDDTGTITARVRGYESMTDVDTGTGPFPTDAQVSGGGYLYKSTAANASAVKYKIVCDERFVLFCIAPGMVSNANNISAAPRGFGDLIPLSPSGDAWSTVLSCLGAANTNYASVGALDSNSNSGAGNGACFSPKAFTGLGSALMLNVASYTGSGTSGSDTTLGSIPSVVDGKVRPSRLFLKEQASGSPARAEVPGVLFLPHSGATSLFSDGDVLSGAGALAGRRLVCVPTGGNYSIPPGGYYLVDITGPWR